MKKFLFIALLVSFSGCGLFRSLSSVETPTVTYNNFHVNGLSLDGVDMLFGFNLTNPNNLEVRAESYRYEFFINNESLVSGTQEAGVELKARDSQIIQVPVSMNFQQLYRAGRSVVNSDSIRYNLDTEIVFDLPVLGSRRVPVKAEGYLPVIRMPQIDFDGIEVNNFSFNGAELVARIRVVNPNLFGFSFGNVGYKLDVNQNEWINSELEDVIRVGPESDTVISIPFSLSGANLGSAVLEILSGNQSFNYTLSGGGEIDVDLPYVRDTAFLPFSISGEHRLGN